MAEAAPMVVTHEGGLRFATDIRGHRLVVDQPEPKGDDSAPMPLELVGAALATCIALYIQQYCASRGLAHEGMRVELRQITTRPPYRIGTFEVKVVLPEPVPAEHVEMLERVARSCPVHNTLMEPPELNIVLETEAPAVA